MRLEGVRFRGVGGFVLVLAVKIEPRPFLWLRMTRPCNCQYSGSCILLFFQCGCPHHLDVSSGAKSLFGVDVAREKFTSGSPLPEFVDVRPRLLAD